MLTIRKQATRVILAALGSLAFSAVSAGPITARTDRWIDRQGQIDMGVQTGGTAGSCADWGRAREFRDRYKIQMYVTWLRGYLDAVNDLTTHNSLVRMPSGAAIESYLDSACRSNASASMSSLAKELYRSLQEAHWPKK